MEFVRESQNTQPRVVQVKQKRSIITIPVQAVRKLLFTKKPEILISALTHVNVLACFSWNTNISCASFCKA